MDSQGARWRRVIPSGSDKPKVQWAGPCTHEQVFCLDTTGYYFAEWLQAYSQRESTRTFLDDDGTLIQIDDIRAPQYVEPPEDGGERFLWYKVGMEPRRIPDAEMPEGAFCVNLSAYTLTGHEPYTLTEDNLKIVTVEGQLGAWIHFYPPDEPNIIKELRKKYIYHYLCFKIVPIAPLRIEVTASSYTRDCLPQIARYIERLLEAIPQRWPEAAQQNQAEGPPRLEADNRAQAQHTAGTEELDDLVARLNLSASNQAALNRLLAEGWHRDAVVEYRACLKHREIAQRHEVAMTTVQDLMTKIRRIAPDLVPARQGPKTRR